MQDDIGELAAEAKRGGHSAVEKLVEAAAPMVRRWALVQTGEAAAADDVAQEVLIRMVVQLDRLRKPERIGAWLYAATRHAAADLFRRRRRDPSTDAVDSARLVSSEPGPQEQRASHELRVLMARLFRTLPRRQREVLDLVELQGMTAPEAGALLGIRAGTVRANLFKARANLRKRLIEEGYGEALR